MVEAVVTVTLGALGYLTATFWFRPVLRYLDAKHAVAEHLVLHANATPGSMAAANLIAEAQEQYRRDAAALAACDVELHRYYRKWIAWTRGQQPRDASGALIGMSNATDIQTFDGHKADLYRALKITKVA